MKYQNKKSNLIVHSPSLILCIGECTKCNGRRYSVVFKDQEYFRVRCSNCRSDKKFKII